MQLIEKDEQIQIQQAQISNLENMCLQLKCKNKKFEIENLGMQKEQDRLYQEFNQ